MRSMLNFVFAAIAVVLLLTISSAASSLSGIEKHVVEISGGVILAVLFLLFIIFSAASAERGDEHCVNCGRSIGDRPCPECKRPPRYS